VVATGQALADALLEPVAQAEHSVPQRDRADVESCGQAFPLGDPLAELTGVIREEMAAALGRQAAEASFETPERIVERVFDRAFPSRCPEPAQRSALPRISIASLAGHHPRNADKVSGQVRNFLTFREAAGDAVDDFIGQVSRIVAALPSQQLHHARANAVVALGRFGPIGRQPGEQPFEAFGREIAGQR
jgi:hypothetical protein